MRIARIFVSSRIWLFLMALLVLCACSRSSRISRHLNRGQTFFKAEQFDKAEIEFLNVLRLQPTNAVALRQLGLGYHQQGRVPQAYAYLQRASQLEPDHDEVRVRLAGILVASGKLKEARDHAEAILSRDPIFEEALMLLADTVTSTNEMEALASRLQALRSQADAKPGFHVAWGTLHLRQRHTNEAVASFQRALSLDAQSVVAHLGLANTYIALRDIPQADFHLKQAADLAPVRSGRRVQYAEFKWRTGDVPAAKSILESVAQRTPDYISPVVLLAEIALAERRLDDGASHAQKVLARDPANYEAALLLGRIHLGQGQPARAIADFERIITAYPRFPQAHYHLAVAHFGNGNPTKAVASLQQALTLDPKHTDSRLLLAEINIRRNDTASAVADLKQLIQEKPQIIQAYFALATALRAQNQLDAAAEVYAQMTALFPRSPQPHFLWGQLLLAQRNRPEARIKFEKAMEVAPDFILPLEDLVELDIADNAAASAEKRVKNLLEKHPNVAALWLLLAKIYSAQKENAKAEDSLARVIALEPDYQPAYAALARIYTESNREQAAVEKLHAALARSTNNVSAWLQLGMIQRQLKNYEAARNAYEKLLVVDPKFVPALNNLASLYSEQLNQLDRAHTLARSARDLRPADPFIADTLGWILYKRGDYPGALLLLQESVDKLSKSSEVQFHLGMTHYMLDDKGSAGIALERALETGQEFPGKAEAQARLAVLSKSSTEPASLAALERQLAANPRDPLLLAQVASLSEQSGAFEKAAAAYNTIVQANPRNVSALLNLAQLYAGPLRDPTNALRVARNARAVAPGDRDVAQTLGRLAFQSGDYKWSLGLLEEGARGPGDQPEPLYHLAWARYSMGRVTDADAAMQQALASGKPFAQAPDAKRFIEMNAIALQPDKPPAVAEQIDSALKHDQAYVPALFATAVVRQRAGDTTAARERYQTILKRFPDFIPAHRGLAALLSKSPATADAALQHAMKAREALPDDAEVAKTLGIVSFHRKDYLRAVQLLRESSAKASKDGEAFFYLGMAHFHLNDKDSSRMALQQALSLNSNAAFAAEARSVLTRLE
jgi:tetratricopeptide (TPR) repeat protein